MNNNKTPHKMVYKLEEVSKITNINPGVITNWENEFYFLHAGQTASGDKIFRKKDLDIIIRLNELLEGQGLTLAGAKRKIEEEFGFKTPVPIHPDRLKKVILEVRELLQEISDLMNQNS